MAKLSGNACPKLLLLATCALAMGLARPYTRSQPQKRFYYPRRNPS